MTSGNWDGGGSVRHHWMEGKLTDKGTGAKHWLCECWDQAGCSLGLSLVGHLGGSTLKWVSAVTAPVVLYCERVWQMTVIWEHWCFFFDRLHDNSEGERAAVPSSQGPCVRPAAGLWKPHSDGRPLNWVSMADSQWRPDSWLRGRCTWYALSDVLITPTLSSNFRCRAHRLN